MEQLKQQEMEFIQPDLNKQVALIEKDISKQIILKSVFNRLWPLWEIYVAQEEMISLLVFALSFFDDVDDLILHLENIASTLNDEDKIRKLKIAGLIGISHYDRLDGADLELVLEVFNGDKRAVEFLAALSKDQLLLATESIFVKNLNILAAHPV